MVRHKDSTVCHQHERCGSVTHAKSVPFCLFYYPRAQITIYDPMCRNFLPPSRARRGQHKRSTDSPPSSPRRSHFFEA